jgi:teichuronic acid exporter
LLTTTQGLAVLTFPAALGLALVADDFVLVAMGEKWEGVIAPLRLLALYASLRSITPMLSQILSITGQSAFVMRNSIIAAFTLPVAFVVGSRWGTTGIATAWIVAHPLVLLPMYQKTFKQLNVTLADYFVALRPAIVGCLWMAAVVALVRVLTIDMPHQVRFVGEALGGAAAYVLVFFKLYRHRFDKLRASWRA